MGTQFCQNSERGLLKEEIIFSSYEQKKKKKKKKKKKDTSPNLYLLEYTSRPISRMVMMCI